MNDRNHIDFCLTHDAQAFSPKRCVLASTGKDCEIVVARVWPVVPKDKET